MSDHKSTAGDLILDERFDLALYRVFLRIASPDARPLLEDLVRVEEGHVAFWESFFSESHPKLDWGRRLKLAIITGICRIFGTPAIHLVLEAIEVYGIRKYLSLWQSSDDPTFRNALKGILEDEFKHEDEIVSALTARRISPENVRSVFLGFNDGLVELTGAVSGFFAAFSDAFAIVLASIMVTVAGAISMAAGVFVAGSSEREVTRTETGKKAFLGEKTADLPATHPLRTACIVGVSYIIGALVSVLPVLFGVRRMGGSLLAGAIMIVFVSLILAFLSGMQVRRRIGMNLAIISLAVGVTYSIGVAAKTYLGVAI